VDSLATWKAHDNFPLSVFPLFGNFIDAVTHSALSLFPSHHLLRCLNPKRTEDLQQSRKLSDLLDTEYSYGFSGDPGRVSDKNIY